MGEGPWSANQQAACRLVFDHSEGICPLFLNRYVYCVCAWIREVSTRCSIHLIFDLLLSSPITCYRSYSFLPIIHYPLPDPLITNHSFLLHRLAYQNHCPDSPLRMFFIFSFLCALPHPCPITPTSQEIIKKSSVPLLLHSPLTPSLSRAFFYFQISRSENSFCRTQSLVYH